MRYLVLRTKSFQKCWRKHRGILRILHETEINDTNNSNKEDKTSGADAPERLANVRHEVGDSLSAESVIDKTHKCNAVSEGLEHCDWIAEDDH